MVKSGHFNKQLRDASRSAFIRIFLSDIKMTETVSAKTMAAAVRALSMDAVERAKSGHPGMPMGMADIAVTLFTRHLRHNPADPKCLHATALSFPTVTAPCCSTRCCI